MLKIRIDIYIFHRFFSRNSRSTKLCGKVPFPLGLQRIFLHRGDVEKNNFSTGPVEEVFYISFSTEILSTFHSLCGKLLECKTPVSAVVLLSCPAKKVTKESGIGEALRLVAPAPEPPSPMYPTRRASPDPLEHLNGQSLFSGYGFTISGGSAHLRTKSRTSSGCAPKRAYGRSRRSADLLQFHPSGKKSEHFLSE